MKSGYYEGGCATKPQLSQDFSHEFRLINIEKIFRRGGNIKFCDRANADFTVKRAKAFRALVLNAVSLLLGVTNYSETVRQNPKLRSEAISLMESFGKLSSDLEGL